MPKALPISGATEARESSLNDSGVWQYTVQVRQTVLKVLPGTLLAIIVAAISFFVEGRFGGPVMLYALVFGAMLNPVATSPRLAPGLSCSANTILKIGVALLAVKITVIDVANLGWQTAGLVVACVLSTMTVGAAIGRVFGLKLDHAILSAGAVAICGSSAALAIASVLPQDKKTECNTIVTVIAVTSLSTIAMVLYPAVASILSLSDLQSGVFMGVSIHNVAQVVGAGYIVSDPAGDIATIVKLMRVACLVPVIIIVSLMFREKGASCADTKKPPLLPLFMVAFILIMMINSAGLIPTQMTAGLNVLSRWALVVAVAALGVKTSLKEVVGVGLRPLMTLTAQTVFLAVFSIVGISLIFAA